MPINGEKILCFKGLSGFKIDKYVSTCAQMALVDLLRFKKCGVYGIYKNVDHTGCSNIFCLNTYYLLSMRMSCDNNATGVLVCHQNESILRNDPSGCNLKKMASYLQHFVLI